MAAPTFNLGRYIEERTNELFLRLKIEPSILNKRTGKKKLRRIKTVKVKI